MINSTKTTVKVYFLVVGDNIHPEDITRKLSLQPDESWAKGDLIPGRDKCREYNYWSIGTDYEESLNISDQFNKVLLLLKDKEDILIEMSRNGELECQFNVVIAIENNIKPGIHLDNTLLEKIHKLNAEVDIDLYIYS
ncbi:DUF4279 domain-containing protein [Xenorhabdus sp. XENO-10]|uniref:DUF4279 domain-containing protein n=1 Tax=Xenorhabdus yunnanensis TaxID=3025878 RepID=A0ABT5LJV7_9GAMM|nr:DUF4279 domain-containing protein [Xenorhabdus yunnanensis]MDC9591400.1 DUF4279 domain-containing protein [Xenorhabdus yunnanensis]